MEITIIDSDVLYTGYYLIRFSDKKTGKEWKELISIPDIIKYHEEFEDVEIRYHSGGFENEVSVSMSKETFFDKYATKVTWEEFDTFIAFKSTKITTHYYSELF